MLRRKGLVVMAIAGMALCRTVGATGLLVPKDEGLPPLTVKSHRVEVRIKDNVARTHLEQVFANNSGRRLEATYIFPIPQGAALTDLAMMINGKRQAGEVVEAGKARQVYEDIVRRMRDPALLEYMDSGLLRLRVFPIEPHSTVKLDLSYSNALEFESGVYGYTFPLKIGTRASKVQDDFTVTVHINTRMPIKNVYSPTHDMGISRKDDHHAVAGFEKTGMMLDTDFTVFYALSREDFGLNLLTHRIEGEDGYFALMLSPSVEMGQDKVMPKDVCFLLDTSGSMREENRIASAKDAVRFCLKSLNTSDRFALITFSSAVEIFGEGLTDVTPEAVEKAIAFVDKIEARGGTALCEAVLKALDMAPDSGRPYLSVLVTDGQPTVGVTEPDDIIKAVEGKNKDNIRVFTFGIAENLNVALLDRIAGASRGYPAYVRPGSEIEQTISAFFRKVSNPVLANLRLSFGGVKVKDVYPGQLPDLSRGSQIVAFGRYDGRGEVAVKLTGTIENRERESSYDASFPQAGSGNDFLPQLWARRKIGYLLDQIRLHGDDKELVDEVVRLSTEYGIATPYTSYLVLENDQAYKDHAIMRGAALDSLARSRVLSDAPAEAGLGWGRDAAEGAEEMDEMLSVISGPVPGTPMGRREKAGEAIAVGNMLRELKRSGALSAESSVATEAKFKRVGSRSFVLFRGAYIDRAYREDMEELRIKWGSDAYFALVAGMPELRPCLALGRTTVIVVDGKALIVAEEGREEVSEAEIKDFFKK